MNAANQVVTAEQRTKRYLVTESTKYRDEDGTEGIHTYKVIVEFLPEDKRGYPVKKLPRYLQGDVFGVVEVVANENAPKGLFRTRPETLKFCVSRIPADWVAL